MQRADPDGEHNLWRSRCPDASYQIWFQVNWEMKRWFCFHYQNWETSLSPPHPGQSQCQAKINIWSSPYINFWPFGSVIYDENFWDNVGLRLIVPQPIYKGGSRWRAQSDKAENSIRQIRIRPVVWEDAEHQSTCKQALRGTILISVHSARWFLTRRFFNKMPDLDVNWPPRPVWGANAKGEHEPTRTYCPDASYQILFESDK